MTTTADRSAPAPAPHAAARPDANVRPLGRILRWGRAPALGWLSAVDLLWTAFVVAMFLTMWLIPGQQTIPYHLIYASFALIYGYRLWSPGATVSVLFAMAAVSGVFFVRVYQMGGISWDELSEIPLMSLIVAGTAWHAHRSAAAQRRVEELAALETSRLDRQRDFLRDTAHAIRTPVTIARGNIELLQYSSQDAQTREDVSEVLHQLDRLHEMARRLLVIEALQTSDLYDEERVEVGDLVDKAGRRWASAATRDWRLSPAVPAAATADRLRLEESLDAMVENALRFTEAGGVIRISCLVEGDFVVIEVADDGPGIPPEDRVHVFDRFFHRHPLGEEPGTGLGLALVAAVSSAFDGDVWAGIAPEGGALLRLRLPRL
jgi:signal transduction histidine kinase